MSQEPEHIDRDEVAMPPQRPGDQFPGFSDNIMATFYRDELRTIPQRRTWPLLILPAAFAVFLAVIAVVTFSN